MLFSFEQIWRTFHEIKWFFHDLEADLNFNDFSRAVGTLKMFVFIDRISQRSRIGYWRFCFYVSPSCLLFALNDFLISENDFLIS